MNENIFFDWKSGFDHYFPRFYQTVEKEWLQGIEDLWKLIFTYAHYRELLTNGLYIQNNLSMTIVIHPDRTRMQWLNPCQQNLTIKQLKESSHHDFVGLSEITMTGPTMTGPLNVFEFCAIQIYESRDGLEKKILESKHFYHLSWCGQYLRNLHPVDPRYQTVHQLYRFVSLQELSKLDENENFSWKLLLPQKKD